MADVQPFDTFRASDATLRRLIRECVNGSQRTRDLDHGLCDAVQRLCLRELERRAVRTEHERIAREVSGLWHRAGAAVRQMI